MNGSNPVLFIDINKESIMYEYKVIISSIKAAESNINEMAKKGYRVVATSPNIAVGHGIVITFEKEKESANF